MSGEPFGKCPLCSIELRLEDELLVCPSGHYAAGAGAFEGRWQEYYKQVKTETNQSAASARLLQDLIDMNIKESE